MVYALRYNVLKSTNSAQFVGLRFTLIYVWEFGEQTVNVVRYETPQINIDSDSC